MDDVLASASTKVDCLATKVRQRIESRLGPRIRNLNVAIRDGAVILTGTCQTYYSKQLAQHAALGVLEDEPLHNEIVVATGSW